MISNVAFEFNLCHYTQTPELSRPQMAAKAKKDLPGIEKAKFPMDPETGKAKELEDMTAADLEPLTAAELITAGGLYKSNPADHP
jgi:hypothetical protein